MTDFQGFIFTNDDYAPLLAAKRFKDASSLQDLHDHFRNLQDHLIVEAGRMPRAEAEQVIRDLQADADSVLARPLPKVWPAVARLLLTAVAKQELASRAIAVLLMMPDRGAPAALQREGIKTLLDRMRQLAALGDDVEINLA